MHLNTLSLFFSHRITIINVGQDWERPKHDFDGFPGTVFDINLNNDQLILHADISDERKEKIKDEILSSLVAHDVRIY